MLADALLAEVVCRGWVAPPVLHSNVPPPRVPVTALAELLQELAQDRADAPGYLPLHRETQ